MEQLKKIINQLLSEDGGLFMGHGHEHLGFIEMFSEDNFIEFLKENNVETIYWEMTSSETNKTLLEEYDKDLPETREALKSYLDDRWKAYTYGNSSLAYFEMFEKLQEAGIRVVGIDLENFEEMTRSEVNDHWATVIKDDRAENQLKGNYMVVGGGDHGDKVMVNQNIENDGITVKMGIKSIDFRRSPDQNYNIKESSTASGYWGEPERVNDSDYFVFIPPSRYYNIGYPELNFNLLKKELDKILDKAEEQDVSKNNDIIENIKSSEIYKSLDSEIFSLDEGSFIEQIDDLIALIDELSLQDFDAYMKRFAIKHLNELKEVIPDISDGERKILAKLDDFFESRSLYSKESLSVELSDVVNLLAGSGDVSLGKNSDLKKELTDIHNSLDKKDARKFKREMKEFIR